ncbi:MULTISPECIES: cupin domain-containing protein [Pseudanabaena]|uniref:Cupin 2 conserved barrel domain protein n=2 Tax=Pseudanabaena TaxID=1152 RepID=L8N627_9CYAN|nr:MULTISPECIES: cupin domain-containing protein [Pseudanabaena]ELS33678.1 Cupin 2 conserved barrel domain protein [Pseudanabaena biceps PCC 7429]MDG3494118.1 cupin domain-containing protein [Pseudanabaena catenata USMAC16]
MSNIYEIPAELNQQEIFEKIISSKNLLIERIISAGQTTPDGEWYDQGTDEWVILLQGKAEIAYFNGERIELKSGDYLLLPAHTKHRVEFTSNEPPCIWLAVHGQLQEATKQEATEQKQLSKNN